MVEALAEIISLGLNLNFTENNYLDNNHSSNVSLSATKASEKRSSSSSQLVVADSTEKSSTIHTSNHRTNSDLSQDTSTTTKTDAVTSNVLKRHQSTNNNVEHNLSSQLSAQPSVSQSGKQSSRTALQQRPSHRMHLPVHSSHNLNNNHNELDEQLSHDDDETHRRHQRSTVAHRNHHQAAVPSKNHDLRVNRLPVDRRIDEGIPLPLPQQPFRLIFMRHSERINQVFGPFWVQKAFRNKFYQPYDENLPMLLPKRRSYQAFEFDSPLTDRGLKKALHLGRELKKMNIVADICLSSCALRCIQTSERILSGMERQNNVSIRIEPGLFECPHFNYKIIESFMTKKELVDAGFNIKTGYTPLSSKLTVPESLNDYFERSAQLIRSILDRYYSYGGTVLIVTHAPGLLALTDAMKGIRPNPETFYRTVATYPPLAIRVASYDGTKWKFTEQS